MPRPQSAPGGRPNVVPVRFSDAELAEIDLRRGPLTRSEWLRFLHVRSVKQGVRFGG